MPLELSSPLRNPSALPNYAHPPLVMVRLSIRLREPIVMDPDALTNQLGPAWIRTAAKADSNHDGIVFQSVLGDQRLEVDSLGINFIWDGGTGEIYPHYESLRDAFVAAFDAWTESSSAPLPPLAYWQVSYRNQIPRGTVWQRLDDLQFCRLLTSVSEVPVAGELFDLQQRWTYRIDDPAAELRCDVGYQPAPTDAILIALTCTGHLDDGDTADWLARFDSGRRLIVATFRNLMSPEANEYWGLVAESVGKKKETQP